MHEKTIIARTQQPRQCPVYQEPILICKLNYLPILGQCSFFITLDLCRLFGDKQTEKVARPYRLVILVWEMSTVLGASHKSIYQ